jgi:rootletin
VKRIEGEKSEQGRSLKEAYKRMSSLEDVKTGLEIESTRLQAHVRDLERQQLQTSHQLQSVHEELQRPRANNVQIQNEEKELLVRLEDSRGRERQLEDEKHNLEVCLADATRQIQELKNRSNRRQELFYKNHLKPYTEIKKCLNAKSVKKDQQATRNPTNTTRIIGRYDHHQNARKDWRCRRSIAKKTLLHPGIEHRYEHYY